MFRLTVCNTMHPQSVRRPTTFFTRPVDSARARLYVTLINNTVVVVYFSELCTVYFTHGRHGGVELQELQLRDGDGSWPKTSHESSSFLVRCRTPCLVMHGLKYPSFYQSYRRACARWLSGLSSSMARTGTAWPRAPPLISFDCFYEPFLPSLNLNFSLFIIDP